MPQAEVVDVHEWTIRIPDALIWGAPLVLIALLGLVIFLIIRRNNRRTSP